MSLQEPFNVENKIQLKEDVLSKVGQMFMAVFQTAAMTRVNAESYLKSKKVHELFVFLASHLVVADQDDPIDYLIDLLDQCMLFRADLRSPPLLFSPEHLEAVFRAFDPAGTGFISRDQYEQGIYSSPTTSLVLTDSSQLTSNSQHLGIYSSPMASLVLTDSSQLTADSQHLSIYSSPVASLVLTDSSQLTADSQHLGIYSSPVASLVLTDSSQLTADSQHLGIYSSPVASLVLTDSSQLTADSQHLGIYSSPVASLVLTDSSQLTSDSQHLGMTTLGISEHQQDPEVDSQGRVEKMFFVAEAPPYAFIFTTIYSTLLCDKETDKGLCDVARLAAVCFGR
uniref:(California timema) hypothetical protein n=1 Tax=Timema californicum TaxID=61474 RepID=A0A7R9JH46_TIMCA|nr:unnamed protein product [Timema californicum]